MKRRQRVLVTGSSGFVGRNLSTTLASHGFSVIAASRSQAQINVPNVTVARLPDLADASANWNHLLDKVDIVVHAAGLAHGSLDDPTHDAINHSAVARLANEAVLRRIKRFVFISSIAVQAGVIGDGVVTEDDEPRPVSAYGRAKLAAEVAVRDSGVCYTILRPTAIYGEGARGNFAGLKRLASLPVPLPFGSLDAPRSFLSVCNLGLAVLCVLQRSAAENKTFLVADPQPSSVRAMLTCMRETMGRGANLLPVPPVLLKAGLIALGMRGIWDRIGEPLVVSADRLQAIGWCPQTTTCLVGHNHKRT